LIAGASAGPRAHARAPSRLAVLAAAAFVAGLAGCAPERLAPVRPALPARPLPAPAPAPTAAIPSLADLPGWREEDHAAALRAFQDGCGVAADADLRAVCQEARALGRPDPLTARVFLETHFRPAVLPGAGLLTAYFAPEYPARRTPDAVFSAPVLPPPADLTYGAPPAEAPLLDGSAPVQSPPAPDAGASVGRGAALQVGPDGATWPYPDRAGIELVAPDDALAWMRPEDLFFLQIQGSGLLDFPDGTRMKAAYAADNGRPFVGIASAMIRQGLLAPDHASGSAIRAWLRDHAGPQAQAVMDLDPRYVFFTLKLDDGTPPVGAAGVALTPGRAVAVDPTWHGYGELYWIDARAPTLHGAVKTYRRLVMALDTGSAIRGNVRADLFLGSGEQAGEEAGRVRHTLLLVRLIPVPGGEAARRP
jgi:membrane-bound lytic murein transglycosylase A